MESLHLLELSVILYLQNLGDWLTMPARAFTTLGDEGFYFLVLPALVWCIDFQLAIRVGIMLILSNNINSVFKLLFHLPRPYWISPGFRISISEASFGFPSGHAQNAVALWGLLAAKWPRKYTLPVILLIFLIGFSRILLAVHFISDVVFGWMIGLALLYLFLKLERPVKDWVASQSPTRLYLYSILSSLSLILLSLGLIFSLRNWTLPDAWLSQAQLSIADTIVDPLTPSGVISLAGLWLGLATGLILLSERYGQFDVSGTLLQKTLRYIIGLIGILILWYGLGKVFPRTVDIIGYSLRYIRYSFTGFWISYLAPTLFYLLRLAGFKPKPLKTP